MDIFVTGGTGFLGSRLIESLVSRGDNVTALARTEDKARELELAGATPAWGDLGNKESLRKAASADFDRVAHLAFSLFPANAVSANRIGVANMSEIFAERQLKRFVFVSSALVYGPTPQSWDIAEDHPAKPTMEFARQQLDAEEAFLGPFARQGYPAVILRPSELIGGEGSYFEREFLAGVMAGKVPIVGDGTNLVSMSYVDDVVDALIASLELDGIDGEVFNVNIPDAISMNDLVGMIERETGCKPPIRIPRPIARAAAAVSSFWAKSGMGEHFLHPDIVKVASMPSGRRSTREAEKRLGFRSSFGTIQEALESCYFRPQREFAASG